MNEKRLLTVLPHLLEKLQANSFFTQISLTIEEMAALFTLAKENPQLIAETLFPYFNFAVSQLRLNPDTYLMRVEQAALIAHRNQLPDDLLVILTMRGIL